MDYEHRVVDYFGNSEIKLGIVVRETPQKLQVQAEGGKTERVALKQLIAVHGPAESTDATAVLAAVRSRIEQTAAAVDGDLLWQELLEYPEPPTLTEIAAAYFGDDTAVYLSAVARFLASDPVRFRRRGTQFSARSAEEVAEVELLRQRRAEKAAERERALSWARSVLSGRGAEVVDVPEEQEEFVRKCSDYLLAGHNSDAVNTLSEAHTKKAPREVALVLLTRTGRLPADADPFLLVNGIHAGFSHAVLEHTDRLPPYAADSRRADHRSLAAFSIDDEETLEVDDAISVTQADGCITVGIHIADPANFVAKEDTLDRVATERPLSLYLPTTTVTMFPEHLSCDLASLKAGELRPSLSFMVRFAPDGRLLDWDFGSAQICVRHRLDYTAADALIANGAGDLGRQLQQLATITQSLRRAREEAGGFNLWRPEIKVRVHGDDIQVERIDPGSPSHLVVSELMILANRLTAEFALRHDIPIIYRVQDPSAEPVVAASTYDPLHFDRQVRKLKRTRLSTHPQPHSGLGLDLYTQVTSPLRRYTDLILQRQLDAYFQGHDLAYEQQELFEVMGTVERTALQNRSLEREAARYWILEFLRRERLGKVMQATVINRAGARIFAEVHEVCERGLLHTSADARPGDVVEVRIRDVHPGDGRLLLETLTTVPV